MRNHDLATPIRRHAQVARLMEELRFPTFLALYPGSFLGTALVSHVYVGNRHPKSRTRRRNPGVIVGDSG